MGIPSYYRKLARDIKNIYCNRPEKVNWLLMDYNCLIYQVLREVDGSGLQGITWEKKFIEDICQYTRKIIEMTSVDDKNVLIALDGVVPMAKMRQQRMRRFKAAAEREAGGWDTNAITPGTHFMSALADALRSSIPEATISDTSESGEGEHKIMEFLKKLPSASASASATADTNNIVIYGLDGDLFVLTLLSNQMFCPEVSFYFLREEQPPKETDSHKKTYYSWVSLNALKNGLLRSKSDGVDDRKWLKEYALAMSLLGNDFVPHGISFRIKDGGHERLLQYLQRLHADRLFLLDADGELVIESWAQLFRFLAADEEHFILRSVRAKMDAAASDQNELPLQRASENEGRLLHDSGKLRKNWQQIYAQVALGASIKGTEVHYLADSARQYIHSLEWTYRYYCKGADSVSFSWMYNYPTAPLFGAVSAIFAGFDLPEEKGLRAKPVEQLALVLPPQSYWLLPACKERQFLVHGSQYFPKKWDYYTFGKRFFWECEAHIPIPTIENLRELC